MSRFIKSDEKCYSALEISNMFHNQYGTYLHPTNVGNAAKKLDLDYLECASESFASEVYAKPTKLYSEVDIPKILAILKELADRRAQFE